VTDRENCPYCSFAISGEPLTLWDERTYCRKCVEAVSPELADFAASGGTLEDVVHPEDAHWVNQFRWMMTRVFGLFMLIAGGVIALLFSGGGIDLLSAGIGLVGTSIFATVFIAVQSLAMCFKQRSLLPRRITLTQVGMEITTPKSTASTPLEKLQWKDVAPFVNELSMATGLRRGIPVKTPNETIVLGHSQDALLHWRAYLTLAKIPIMKPLGCMSAIVATIIGLVLGIAAGMGIGYGVSIATEQPLWVAALGFMGMIDGVAIAVCISTCEFDGANAAKLRLHPALLGLTFLALGMQFGSVGGWPGVVLLGGINALVGILVGLYCRMRINAAEVEQDVKAEFRR